MACTSPVIWGTPGSGRRCPGAAGRGTNQRGCGKMADVPRSTRGIGVVVFFSLVAAPVVAGVLLTLGRLLTEPHPDVGWPAVINSDAAALVTGQGIYNDPDSGYSGMFFTPLFPVVLAGLFHLAWWEGWGALLAIMSSVALGAVAGTIAVGPRAAVGAPFQRVIEALGLGALAWSFVATLAEADFDQGRPDQSAWTLAIGGLLLVPRALSGSKRATGAAVVLLSAGLWTKQTTAPVLAIVVVAAAVTAVTQPGRRRSAALLAGALVALNVAAFGLFAVATDGWGPRWTVGLVRHFPVFQSNREVLTELCRDLALVLAFTVLCAILAARSGSRVRRLDMRASLLIGAAVATALAGMWGRRLEGSSDHNYIGTVWCLAMLGAAAYHSLRVRRPNLALALVAAVALTTLIPGEHWFSLRRGVIVDAAQYLPADPALASYARHHAVYTPARADYGARQGRPVYPNAQHLLNVIEGHYRPGFLLSALLHRRFDAVYRFDERQTPFVDPRGEFEDNFLWKLNRVVAAKYQLSQDTPLYSARLYGAAVVVQHGFVPRPGPDPAPWMNRCFGPFSLSGEVFDIGRGGGFWCKGRVGGADQLRLRDTPEPESEIVSRRPVPLGRDALVVGLPGPTGPWQLAGGPLPGNDRLTAAPVPRGLRLLLSGRERANLTLPRRILRSTRGSVTLRFALGPAAIRRMPRRPATLVITTPRRGDARLRFAASRGSGARFAITRR